MKKYNFNAGPSMLPREVIENTAKQILDFNGSGLSLMEICHRAKISSQLLTRQSPFSRNFSIYLRAIP